MGMVEKEAPLSPRSAKPAPRTGSATALASCSSRARDISPKSQKPTFIIGAKLDRWKTLPGFRDFSPSEERHRQPNRTSGDHMALDHMALINTKIPTPMAGPATDAKSNITMDFATITRPRSTQLLQGSGTCPRPDPGHDRNAHSLFRPYAGSAYTGSPLDTPEILKTVTM